MTGQQRIAGCPVADFAGIEPVPCPCGRARRAFGDVEELPGTLHLTEIGEQAAVHYHRTLTETYYILECAPGSCLELNGQRLEVHPGMSVVIPPGTRHRAVGRMKILNFVLPKFDPDDEWFD